METVYHASGDGQEFAAAEFQIRPLTTGQILDRSFSLYRSHFGLFAGFAVFPAAVSLLFGLMRIIYLLMVHQPIARYRLTGVQSLPMIGLYFGSWIAQVCVYGISMAATTWCIAAIYQGGNANMKMGFEFAFRKWYRYILLWLAQIWSVAWLPGIAIVILTAAVFLIPGMKGSAAGVFVAGLFFLSIIGAMVWMLIRFLRVSLAIPACVVENLKVLESIRRSKQLLTSRKGRVFLLLLLIVVLDLVFVTVVTPFSMLMMRSGPTQALIASLAVLLAGFLFGVLVSPVYAVGICLFYFDERVRREGFDIEFLMRKAAEASAPPAMDLPAES